MQLQIKELSSENENLKEKVHILEHQLLMTGEFLEIQYSWCEVNANFLLDLMFYLH